MSAWRVRAIDVRAHEGGRRWKLEASADDGAPLVVVADTDNTGRLLDLQAGDAVGSTGDELLDVKVAARVADLSIAAKVVGQLLELDRTSGRAAA
jgi:hypothetical protein